MKEERIAKAKRLFDENGPVIRATVLRKNRFCSKDIAELLSDGLIYKLKTGYYVWGSIAHDLSDLELAVSLIPNGVVSLFSAARFYEMTTVNPTSINITVPALGNLPVLPDYPPITLYKMVKNMYSIGIIEAKAPNYEIKIYDKERTVCDFFRMRRQFGEDVALEILKNYMSGAKNIQKLYEYAAKMRIKSVIKPYVEALL